MGCTISPFQLTLDSAKMGHTPGPFFVDIGGMVSFYDGNVRCAEDDVEGTSSSFESPSNDVAIR